MIDELVQPISTPTSTAVWLCPVEWQMSSDLPKVIRSQQLWQRKGAIFHACLNALCQCPFVSGWMALRMSAKIKLFQLCCVSQFSNSSSIRSWGCALGERPHSNKRQAEVYRALHIPPLFIATFSVEEKKQRQIVLKTSLNSASIKLKMSKDDITIKMLHYQVRFVTFVLRHLTFHIGN